MSASFRRPGSGSSGSFTCFHGEKEKRPPLDADALTGVHITNRIDGFYEEAARRLPLKEMPELDGCICAGGLCIGLADPVANIILNAVALLRHPAARRRRREPTYFLAVATGSETVPGLVAFMATYFRHLGDTQARRYIHLASHDLALAIRLVRHDLLSPHQRRPLLPDGGKLKHALMVAAVGAGHPAPDLLAGVMTAEYPAALLAPVLAKLRGTQPLTARDVSEVGDLLARQWPPYPPPATVELRCRPDGVTCTRADDGTLRLATCLGEGIVATVVIASTRNQFRSLQLEYISGVTFDNNSAADTEMKRLQGQGQAAAVAVDYDASPCEHIVSVKLCLLDTIHAFYIRALAIMPRGAPSRRLLRALLVAGHCYGPMDPVSNIVVNSVWYAAAFPLAEGAEAGLPDGIVGGTRAMSRMGLRSLDGLVAMVRDGDRDHWWWSEHEALEYLNALDCDLSSSTSSYSYLASRRTNTFAAAAMAAKHPQHAAFGSFLASMSSSEELINRLRCLLTAAAAGGNGIGISDAHWDELNAIVAKESEAARSGSVCASATPLPFCFGPKKPHASETFVHTQLNKLLHEYCYQHPWEPSYRLDIICGVWKSRNFHGPGFYHANFLASPDTADADAAAAAAAPRERTLFFAELFETTSYAQEVPQSSCYPVYDYRASTGRCSFCENEIRIAHPPSGGHSGEIHGPGDLRSCGVGKMDTLSECSPESDFENDVLGNQHLRLLSAS